MTTILLNYARTRLGHDWGLNRPLSLNEMGRALRFTGRDPGRYMASYEAGRVKIPGPVSVAVEMMLAGSPPPVPMAKIVII